jgi:hypothetical protein
MPQAAAPEVATLANLSALRWRNSWSKAITLRWRKTWFILSFDKTYGQNRTTKALAPPGEALRMPPPKSADWAK